MKITIKTDRIFNIYLVGKISSVEYLSKCYTSYLGSLKLNLDKLDEVIITDEFLSDVNCYKRENGYEIMGITDDGENKAFAITLKNKKNRFTIFIDSIIGLCLDESVLKKIFIDGTNEIGVNRLVGYAKNIVAHECSHVEMDSFAIYEIRTGFDKKNIIDGISERLIQEYYACKSASVYSGENGICSDYLNAIKPIEEKIEQYKSEYQHHKLSINDFAALLIQQVRISLIYAVSLYGNYGMKLFENISELKLDCIINELIVEMDNWLARFKVDKRILITDKLESLIEKYLLLFGINIRDTNDGIYIEVNT